MTRSRVHSVPSLSAGEMIAGRYRLLRLVTASSRNGVSLWQGRDEVLARPVGVRMLPSEPRERSEAFLAAARRAATVSGAGLVRMYDAGVDDDIVFAVAEWVDGTSLDTAVAAGGPLDADTAVTVVCCVADALDAAGSGGLHHGRLHPGNVLISDDGRVSVSGVATAAAAAGVAVVDAEDREQAQREDAQSLGRLLYFALTGCWPGPERPDLPPAPHYDGRLCSPRQVRAGVPAPVDRVVKDLLDEPAGVLTPRVAAQRLRATRGATAPQPVTRSSQDDDVELEQDRPARRVRIAVLLGIAALVGGVGYLAGSALDVLPGSEGAFPALHHDQAPGRQATTGDATGPVRVVSASAFDPFGDRTENDDQIRFALDNDPTSAWHTDRYFGKPNYGGLKPGVGLLLDLGRPTAVTAIHLRLVTPGADLQIRAGDHAPATPDELAPAGTVTDAPVDTVATTDAGAHRYWLIWITKLPSVGGGDYREGIASVTVEATEQS